MTRLLAVMRALAAFLRRDVPQRVARTFLQAFLAVVTAGPMLDLSVSTLKAAWMAGLAALISLLQAWLYATDSSTGAEHDEHDEHRSVRPPDVHLAR